MESPGWINEVLTKENETVVRKIVEGGGDLAFAHSFQQAFQDALHDNLSQFPLVNAAEPEQREGSVGIYPSPAKPIVARELLSGRNAPPLKVADEERHSQEQVRTGEVMLHLIAEVNSLESADPATLGAFTNTVLSVSRIIDQRQTLRTWAEGGESLSLKRIQAALHLIQRGARGNYTTLDLPVRDRAEALKAINAYTLAANNVVKPDKNAIAEDDYVSHQLIGRDLAVAFQQDPKRSILQIPVLINPKNYTLSNKQDDRGINVYTGDSTPGQRLIIVDRQKPPLYAQKEPSGGFKGVK